MLPLFNCGTLPPVADRLQAKSETAGMGFEEYGTTAIPSEKNGQRAYAQVIRSVLVFRSTISPIKKAFRIFSKDLFLFLVAGRGFEPLTFGL